MPLVSSSSPAASGGSEPRVPSARRSSTRKKMTKPHTPAMACTPLCTASMNAAAREVGGFFTGTTALRCVPAEAVRGTAGGFVAPPVRHRSSPTAVAEAAWRRYSHTPAWEL